MAQVNASTSSGGKGSIAAYSAWVGKDLDQPPQFNYEVSRDSIRHFAHAVDDYNALYLDPEYARSTVWGGIIAPPGYLSSHGQSIWIATQLSKVKDEDGNALSLVAHAADEWQFIAPVRPGDSVLSYSKLAEAELKHGKNVGTSILLKLDTRYVNQHGDPVANRRGLYFNIDSEKGAAGSESVYPPLGLHESRNVILPTRFPGTFEVPPLKKGRSLRFEDVSVGDALTPLQIPPVYLQHLGRYNAATIGTGADEVGGAHGGMPDAYVFGHLRIPWFARLIIDWAGPDAWVSRLQQRNKQWHLIGFAATCRGQVAAKGTDGGEQWLDLSLTCESELGFVTNTGEARVNLRSRHS